MPGQEGKIRYAVVGLGHIAQTAVLPAFGNAKENSLVTALVSGNPKKLSSLREKYQVPHAYSYEEYERCLRSGEIDAVYIALPNSLHRDYAVRAAQAGIHVLCEKPLGLSTEECNQMVEACRKHKVKLMTAYRLHFDEANLKAIDLSQTEAIGEARLFSSVFSICVKEGNIRLSSKLGGGPLWDLGVYCINAARYLFQDEPIEVFGMSATGRDPRFTEVEESFAALLNFPQGRLAQFTCAFNSPEPDEFTLVGTKGQMRLCPAFTYDEPRRLELTTPTSSESLLFGKTDQFGPELMYFSNCILRDEPVEPSGEEGLADVRIIEALYRSAATGRPVKLKPVIRRERPSLNQRIYQPAIKPPKPIEAEEPAA